MATIRLGSVTFPEPLIWLRPPPVTMGKAERSLTGDLIVLRPYQISQRHVYISARFECVPWSTIATLRTMARESGTFTFVPEDSGTSYTVMFPPKDGLPENEITNWAHDKDFSPYEVSGQPQDLWNGVLNLIVVTET